VSCEVVYDVVDAKKFVSSLYKTIFYVLCVLFDYRAKNCVWLNSCRLMLAEIYKCVIYFQCSCHTN